MLIFRPGKKPIIHKFFKDRGCLLGPDSGPPFGQFRLADGLSA